MSSSSGVIFDPIFSDSDSQCRSFSAGDASALVDEFYSGADVDGDGTISRAEFIEMVHREHPGPVVLTKGEEGSL